MTTQQDADHTPEIAKPRPRWKRIALIVALAVLLMIIGTGVALTLAANSFQSSGIIARNVLIEGVPVSGMTTEEAVGALHREWVPLLPDELELVYPGGSYTVPRRKLGAELQLELAATEAHRVARVGGLVERIRTQISLRRDPVEVQVECRVDESALDAAVADAAGRVNRQPMDAEVEVSDDDKVTIKDHVNGLVVKLDQSKAALVAALKEPGARQIELAVEEQAPHITGEDLSHLETVLASYTTKFNSGQVSRTTNLRIATKILDRKIIMPGEVFSINDIVGERTPERGFKPAPIFWTGGELRQSTGGGLCQVASTAFNTALLANMQVVERSSHVRAVDYVPLGRDAAVLWGSKDMRWRNSMKHPVLFIARDDSNSLTYKIIGSEEDKAEVRVTSDGGRSGVGEKEVPDPNLPEGKRVLEKRGWRGGWGWGKRETKIDDEWEQTWYARSSYISGPNVYRVGSKKPDEPPEGETGPEPAVPTDHGLAPAPPSEPSVLEEPDEPASE